MQKMNCIVVFDKKKESVLFCRRQKDPFKGRLNFVGGKVEAGESSVDAAYRELEEETGIGRGQIRLYRLMDITYYYQDFVLEMYVGMLDGDVVLQEEKNPLLWLPLTDDFTDRERFAGEQNIAHIINIALMYPIPARGMFAEGQYVGIDGCRGGWITAVLDHGQLRLERYDSVEEIVKAVPAADAYLIDMAIGLPENEKEMEWRPDAAARKELGRRGATVFSVPCRQAVEIGEENSDDTNIAERQRKVNIAVLGKSLSAQSINIIPKIREIDQFLCENAEYKNVFCEAHPEVCFARLNGSVLETKKKHLAGIEERCELLRRFLEEEALDGVHILAKELSCAVDDILDAVCLAVVAAMKAHGMCGTIPEKPVADARGLLMQMVAPL